MLLVGNDKPVPIIFLVLDFFENKYKNDYVRNCRPSVDVLDFVSSASAHT